LKDKKDWKTDLERVTQRQRKSEKGKGNKSKKLENERMKKRKTKKIETFESKNF
jgi:hypothetical protein